MLVRRKQGHNGVPQEPTTAPKPASSCEKVRSWFRNFGFGVIAGSIAVPISSAAIYLTQNLGLLPKLPDHESLLKESFVKLAKLNVSLDATSILKSTCPIQEYVTQFNRAFPEMGKQTVLSMKGIMVGATGFMQPILEETFFRGIFQDLVLRRFCTSVIQKISPEQAPFFRSTTAKVMRIFLTAGFFALMHLGNAVTMPTAYVAGQVGSCFLKGLFYGALKESSGLASTIGAHMANNLLAIRNHLISC
ncbi:MAG: CPBP family intramembrane metalloprotease [Parachlamydiales bacterium]|nr:CPBP family intramembrane metalloprotease [Parachlamydiales bacterium]